MRTIVHQIKPAHAMKSVKLPLYLEPVKAGFPSPAEDLVDSTLDLNDHLVKHPAATFFVKVSGNSMSGAGIRSGDILVVDRSLNPYDGAIIVAVVDGEMTVKRVLQMKQRLYLVPDNPDFQPLEISAEMNFQVWGVVTYVIHKT